MSCAHYTVITYLWKTEKYRPDVMKQSFKMHIHTVQLHIQKLKCTRTTVWMKVTYTMHVGDHSFNIHEHHTKDWWIQFRIGSRYMICITGGFGDVLKVFVGESTAISDIKTKLSQDCIIISPLRNSVRVLHISFAMTVVLVRDELWINEGQPCTVQYTIEQQKPIIPCWLNYNLHQD